MMCALLPLLLADFDDAPTPRVSRSQTKEGTDDNEDTYAIKTPAIIFRSVSLLDG
jgi:hypothetical protein